MANDFSTDSRIIAVYNMESGALTTDSKGSNTMSLVGTPLSETTEFRQGAGSLDTNAGKNGIELADASQPADWPNQSTNEDVFTVAMWARFHSTATVPLWEKFGVMGAFSDASGMAIAITGGSNPSLNFTPTLNRWYHLTFFVDQPEKSVVVRIYDSITDTAHIRGATYTVALTNNTNQWGIGASTPVTVSPDTFIDEVVIANEILTMVDAQRIQQGTFGTTINRIGPLYYPNYVGPVPPSKTFWTFNNASHRWAVLTSIEKTGTIERVHFEVGAVLSTFTARISLQDVTSGTHGPTQDPDGTQDQFVDRVITTSTDDFAFLSVGPLTNNGLSGGTRRSVTAGDVIAIVVEVQSGTPNTTITYLDDAAFANGSGHVIHTPKITTFDGSSWTGFSEGLPLCLIEYDDGTFHRGNIMPYDLSVRVENASPAPLNFDIGLNTTPDEIGIRFIPEATIQVIGGWSFGRTQDTKIVLYDEADTELTSVDTGEYGGTMDQYNFHHFPTPVTLQKGNVYRLTHRYLNPTADPGPWAFTVSANNVLDSLSGGVEMYWTERTNAGAWTDVTTQRPQIGLIVNGVDQGGVGTINLNPRVPIMSVGSGINQSVGRIA